MIARSGRSRSPFRWLVLVCLAVQAAACAPASLDEEVEDEIPASGMNAKPAAVPARPLGAGGSSPAFGMGGTPAVAADPVDAGGSVRTDAPSLSSDLAVAVDMPAAVVLVDARAVDLPVQVDMPVRADAALPDLAPRPVDMAPAMPDAAPKIPTDYARVFNLSILHRIDIKVDTQYINTLNTDTSKRVPSVFTFNGTVLPNTGIRKKGGLGSPRDLFDKTGFSVDFHEYTKTQRLFGLKKITLNNAVQDPTFVSEHTGYELYRRAGQPAALTAHALVTFNNQPFGLYVLKESIDGEFLDHAFGAANDNGNLYEGNCCADFVPDVYVKEIELKDEVAEKRTRNDLKELSDLVQRPADAAWTVAVGAKLDLENFITGLTLDALMDHWDGYSFKPNNYYIYNNPGIGKFVFLPHGMDQLFQADSDPQRAPVGRVAQRIRQIPELDKRFQDKLNLILTTLWDLKIINERIDQVGRILATYTPTDKRTMDDFASYRNNVQRFKDAISRRKPAVPRPGDGTGLKGEYFDNADLTNLKVTRTDNNINFNWGDSSPDPSIAPDSFSVRWTGFVQPEFSEDFTFAIRSDDGVRVWIDNQLIIDNWTDHAPTENTGTVTMVKDRKHAIKIEYFESGGGAELQLSWSSPSRNRELVPRYRLFPM